MSWQTIRALLYTLPWLAIGGFAYREVFGGSSLIGWCSVIVYLSVVGRQWEHIFEAVYGVKERDVFRSVLGIGFVVCLIGFAMSAVVVFGFLSPGVMTGVAAVVSTLTTTLYALRLRLGSYSVPPMRPGKEMSVWSLPPLFYIVFILLCAVLVFLMSRATSTGAYNTVWHIYDSYIGYVGFGLFLFLFIAVFSKTKVSRILLCIVGASFVLHTYLAFGHTLPWGADTWRHLAVESQLLTGKPYGPTLFDKPLVYKVFAGVPVPEVLFAQHKFNYGTLWGLSTFFVRLTGTDLVKTSIWLGPTLFGLLVPLLMFRIGAVLFRSWRHALMVSALSLLPFSLQAVGALTLPVTLGVIHFLFFLWFLVTAMAEQKKGQTAFAVCFLCLLPFGYVVTALLAVLTLVGSFAWRFATNEYESLPVQAGQIFVLIMTVGGLLLCIPGIELVSGLSSFKETWNVVDAGRHMFGELSGWGFARGIVPHDVLPGNILFNRPPSDAFVPNVFLTLRWHVFVLMVVALVLSFRGFIEVQRLKIQSWIPFLILTFVAVGGYIISWYMFDGEHSFARRLDPYLAILLTLWSVSGAIVFVRFSTKRWKRFGAGLVTLCLAWVGVSAWTSGPDMQVVAVTTVEAANDIASHAPTCVLADTWSLLPIEYVSQGTLVGGGFPIDRLFGQPERVRLYSELTEGKEVQFLRVFNEAKKATGASSCAVLVPKGSVPPSVEREIDLLLKNKQENADWVWWLAGEQEPGYNAGN